MKQTLTLFAALVLLAVGATAQKLSYSAVVRNSANELQANKTLTVGVSIANSATGSPAVYSETHSGVQTNQNGLLTLTIGEGTNVSGNLTQVTWPSAYITTTYTIDGSTVTNTVAVNAVPYALYAENSGTSTPVNDGTLTIKQGENTLGTFTANQAGQTNVNIPAAPTVNDGMLTIKQGENTLGTFSANQVGPTEVNIPAAPVVNNGTLTINMPDGTAKTFTANQSDPTEVTIPTYTLTAGDLINVINNMNAEEKAQMCAALAALGCSGTEPTPPTPTPVCPSVDLEGNTFQLNKGTENYSASFGYNPGSGNPTVTAAYSTTSGGAFQCTNCMTVNAIGGVISISIPVDAITLSPAEQLIVTITITSDVCDQVLTLTGTYEETQIPTFECPTFTNDPTALTLTADGAEIMAYTSEYVEENTAVTNYGFRVYTVTDGVETLLFTLDHSNYPNNVYPEIDNDNDKALIGAFVSMSALPTIAGISLDELAAVGTIYKVYPFITCANETNNGNPVEYTVSGGETPTPVDGQPCPGTPTVEDHDGNVYNTVQIGTQCWTKENMRVVPANATNGTNLTSNNYSNDEPFYYINPNVDASVYGYYYNWSAANQVCPEGWHLPSTEEWTTMEQTQTTMDVSGTAATLYGDYAGKLAADGWYTSSTAGAPGYAGDPNHNASGFSIVPAGKWDEGFYSKSYAANFWTSTGIHEDNAWSRTLNYDYVAVGRAGYNRYHGYSVRCVMDAEEAPVIECPTVGEATVTPYSTNTPTVMVIEAQIQNYSTEVISVENSGVKINNANGSSIDMITAGSNPGNIEISDAGVMTATIDCANYSTVFYVVPFIASYCSDGEILENFTDVEGTPVEVTMTTPTPTTPVDGQPCLGAATVTDHEGNVYNTVQIGNQCWTKENMRCTTSPSTGKYIVNNTSDQYTYTGKMAKWYNNDSVAAVTAGYGLLYNWNAAVDTFNTAYGETDVNPGSNYAVSVTFTGHRRGICPEGWHVPSDAEWTDLTNYLDSCRNEAGQYKYRCDQNEEYIAKALASTTGWNTNGFSEDSPCELRYNPATTNNASGFGAVPAGSFESSFYYAGNQPYFWSATQYNSYYYAYRRFLRYSSPYVYYFEASKDLGSSVRCLKDETSGGGETPTTECPTLGAADVTLTNGVLFATTPINGTYDNSVEFHYDITWLDDDNHTHAATANYVETENNVLTLGPNGFALSNINDDLSGKTITVVPSCTCNVAAGETVEFGTDATVTVPAATTFVCGTSTVEDHQHNVYHTVKIGTQCWTKENMRCTTSPKGNLTEGSEASYYQPYYYNNADASTNRNIPLEDRGMYYNWAGAMDTVFATTDDRNVSFEGRRGICPEGWHVPSDAEWTQMQEYVSNYKENDEYKYRCGGDATFIAKALAIDKDYWIIEPDVVHEPCEPDYAPTTNNATGFSAVPAGNWNHMNNNTGFYNAGKYACFWSSSSYDSDNVFYHYLVNYYDVMGRISFDKRRGFSVRCLRD